MPIAQVNYLIIYWTMVLKQHEAAVIKNSIKTAANNLVVTYDDHECKDGVHHICIWAFAHF